LYDNIWDSNASCDLISEVTRGGEPVNIVTTPLTPGYPSPYLPAQGFLPTFIPGLLTFRHSAPSRYASEMGDGIGGIIDGPGGFVGDRFYCSELGNNTSINDEAKGRI